ncbi:dTMP kinase [Elioraea rosea]|uniref:dTMP kinase n=1 Tax=Elioraea rosea TaxID=2492390 RepID=UPI0011832261|nr:dTMP kinase [Elioraea rosea]
MRGRFITLEGGEGAGKTTQRSLLAASLRASGLEVLETREPGGEAGAEAIRALLVSGEPGRWEPLAETLLHYAARAQHVARVIEPGLARGAWVVSDRFADSTAVYQGAGQGLAAERIAAVHAATLGGFAPDLTLILDVPVETGLARAGQRGETNRYERFDAGFHARIREGFLAIAAAEPRRCTVIDASRPPGQVAAAIREALGARLGLSLPDTA